MYHIIYKYEDELYYESIKDLHEIALIEHISDGIVKVYNTHEGMNNKTYKSQYNSLMDKTLMILTGDFAECYERPGAKLVKVEHPWDRTLSMEEVKYSKNIMRALQVDNQGTDYIVFKRDKGIDILNNLENYQSGLEKEYVKVSNEIIKSKKQLIEMTARIYNSTNKTPLTDEEIDETYDRIKNNCTSIENNELTLVTLGNKIMTTMEIKNELEVFISKIELETQSNSYRQIIYSIPS